VKTIAFRTEEEMPPGYLLQQEHGRASMVAGNHRGPTPSRHSTATAVAMVPVEGAAASAPPREGIIRQNVARQGSKFQKQKGEIHKKGREGSCRTADPGAVNSNVIG
jgi:hypothetical protein